MTVGRHSRKDPAAVRPVPEAAAYEAAPHGAAPYGGGPYDGAPFGGGPYDGALFDGGPYEAAPYDGGPYGEAPYDGGPYGSGPHGGPHDGRLPAPGPRAPEPTVVHQGYAPPAGPARPGGHPERWDGADARWATPFETPAEAFPRIVVEPVRAPDPASLAAFASAPAPAPASAPDSDALTATGSHRRIPAPRTPDADVEGRPVTGRGTKIRTYTGMAAAAVTTVLAVVVAGQVATERETATDAARATGDDAAGRALSGQSAASRSEGRPTPATPPPVAAAPLTFEEQMARQVPIDAKLAGPGTFDTVPGIAKAPGKGRVVRYRVDVEQGLGLDPQLFAEAVQRTLNDPRSWAHGGAMTFERVPGGEAEFVITLASPGTTGTWCAKSGLDTTVDNVSCDSASTERVMINAFRWAQGSVTYGPDKMLAYRQMLINHEVGHRLGHGHVSCRTPGSLAPIMQQQTKSLDIDNISCKPNPWVYPGN
ncbi:DUF3152 domain-containing protein [Streptomyces sp. NPDC048606]|uniref:DUF3152 domain-containing protein n=1 Tax=Streptomyces sp. NPDC048606 TaxID=3154726 RepID=UPI0034404DF6